MRIGSASSGTKSSLSDRFKQDLARPSSLRRRVETGGGKDATSDQHDLRIVSIDMGIKNLAYCVANLRRSSPSNTPKQPSAAVDISAWKKIDLIERTREYHTAPSNVGNIEETDMDGDLDTFSLAVLSRTAYRLVIQEVLSHEPDIILIEKQRWRSSGGSAIQQWTIRVNTLEAMLWAILETQKGSAQIDAREHSTNAKRDYQVFAIDPKRVGHYWLEQHARAVAEKTRNEAHTPSTSPTPEEPAQGKKLSRSKAEKKAKISLLRSWLSSTPASNAASTPLSYPEITFTFDPDTEPIRQAIYVPQKPTLRKRAARKAATSEPQYTASALAVDTIADAELSKLDDVTDCFLQAAAWVAWELNRLQLLNARESEGRGRGESPLLDDEAVLDMIRRTRWTEDELVPKRMLRI